MMVNGFNLPYRRRNNTIKELVDLEQQKTTASFMKGNYMSQNLKEMATESDLDSVGSP